MLPSLDERREVSFSLKKKTGLGILAGSVVEHATLGLEVVSLNPTLGVEIT